MRKLAFGAGWLAMVLGAAAVTYRTAEGRLPFQEPTDTEPGGPEVVAPEPPQPPHPTTTTFTAPESPQTPAVDTPVEAAPGPTRIGPDPEPARPTHAGGRGGRRPAKGPRTDAAENDDDARDDAADAAQREERSRLDVQIRNLQLAAASHKAHFQRIPAGVLADRFAGPLDAVHEFSRAAREAFARGDDEQARANLEGGKRALAKLEAARSQVELR
jgi:hypothetical protein